MFRTDVSCLHYTLRGASEDQLYWSQVQLTQHSSFLLVEGTDLRSDEPKTVVTLSRISELHRIELDPNLALTAVAVVSPGYVRGADGWAMDYVSELWTCESNCTPVHGWLFVLHDGREMVSCSGVDAPRDVRRLKPIYKRTQARELVHAHG